jgi:lysophospholipase L1-like esterase
MKNQRFLSLLVGACLCLSIVSARAQNQTINIMAMGDSVTARGSTPESSFRYWLYVDLTNGGFANIAFVGSQFGVSDGTPANSWPDEYYEGGDGWTTADGISDAPSAAGTLGQTAPEAGSTGPSGTILLLDLGANDYSAGEPTKTNLLEVQQNLETIIQTFASANSSTVIVLAVPTGSQTTDPGAKKFMSGLAGAVSKAARDQKKAGVNVVTVNLFGGYNVRTDTVDGTHPDIKGEQQIAKKYFNVLRPVLKKMVKNGA